MSETPQIGLLQIVEKTPMADTAALLRTLRRMAAYQHDWQGSYVTPWDAEELCDMGFAIDFGDGRYALTGEGRDLLKKAEEIGQPASASFRDHRFPFGDDPIAIHPFRRFEQTPREASADHSRHRLLRAS